MKNNLSIKDAKRQRWEDSRKQRLREEEYVNEERLAASNVNRIMTHHRESSQRSNRSRCRVVDEIQKFDNDIDKSMIGAVEYNTHKQHLDDLCNSLYATAQNFGRANLSNTSAARLSTKDSESKKSSRSNSRVRYTNANRPKWQI